MYCDTGCVCVDVSVYVGRDGDAQEFLSSFIKKGERPTFFAIVSFRFIHTYEETRASYMLTYEFERDKRTRETTREIGRKRKE